MPTIKWPTNLTPRPVRRCGWCGCPTTSQVRCCTSSICRDAEAIHAAKKKVTA